MNLVVRGVDGQVWANAKASNRTADGNCQVVIDILKRTVATTWSDVWTALEVVNARCVRAGKGGHAIVAAALPGTAIPTTDLSVTIMDEPNPAVWTGKPDDTQPEAVGIAVA